MEDRWIETGRGRMAARVWQSPDCDSSLAPVILFHDSLGCIDLWRNFPSALAVHTRRRVIAYDRLGFGRSDRRTAPLNLDFVSEEAESFFPALREGLEINRFVAFGHSVGGGMAVHCAALHVAGCEALITESAQACVEDKTLAGIREAKEQFKQPDAFERLQRYHGDKAGWVLDAWTETWLSPNFATWSLKEILPRVLCPALVIHGSDDEYGSQMHPRTIAGLMGGVSQMEIMPGVRHVPHREQEAWVVERVAGFLATIAG